MILPIKNLTIAQLDGYPADSGEDLGVPVGTPVYAVADSWIIYSEKGHTKWGTSVNIGIDTPNSILLKFKTPIEIYGKQWIYAWYTHLSELVYQIPDNGNSYKEVEEGTLLGKTGTGNLSPHLHFGLLLNRAQADGDFMIEKDLHRFLMSLLITPVADIKKRYMKAFYHDGLTRVLNEGKEIYVSQVIKLPCKSVEVWIEKL